MQGVRSIQPWMEHQFMREELDFRVLAVDRPIAGSYPIGLICTSYFIHSIHVLAALSGITLGSLPFNHENRHPCLREGRFPDARMYLLSISISGLFEASARLCLSST